MNDMFQIKNVKVSLKINEISLNSVLKYLLENQISFEIKSNYLIIKDKFIYIFFRSKNNLVNHINITKIPSIEHIKESINFLRDKILKQLYIINESYKIDNLTAIYDYGKQIDQLNLIHKVKNTYNIRYNKEKFPGIFIKVATGTFIIFHTGKINLVGCQNPSHLPSLFNCLTNILN
jgi:TATA-box binding protein (TBP) (component of TFIID and TFIIIB)